jgi:PHD/YefM family antitoxin component YafN of YafNO toxin-antitoxin module
LEKARKEPVAIQRNGVITHVLVSLEDYKELMRKKESPGKIRKSLPP